MLYYATVPVYRWWAHGQTIQRNIATSTESRHLGAKTEKVFFQGRSLMIQASLGFSTYIDIWKGMHYNCIIYVKLTINFCGDQLAKIWQRFNFWLAIDPKPYNMTLKITVVHIHTCTKFPCWFGLEWSLNNSYLAIYTALTMYALLYIQCKLYNAICTASMQTRFEGI